MSDLPVIDPEPTGVWTCSDCAFVLYTKALDVSSGRVGYSTKPRREVCPNDGKDMLVVSRETLALWEAEARADCATGGHVIYFGRCACGDRREEAP